MPAATAPDLLRARMRATAGEGRGFLLGAAIGTGLAAQAATRGGADFLLALHAGRVRSMGEPSVASLLALADTNRSVLDFATAEIRPRTGLPVFVGAVAFDPRLDVEAFLARVAAAGFEGVTNFPTVALLDGRFRRFLEATGYGFAREMALLAAAKRRGLATLAYVHTRAEARAACAAGADVVNIDLGWNTGGTLGVTTAMRIEEAAEFTLRIVRTVRRSAPGALCVVEGGPIVSPEQADQVCRAADLDGYVGGSTIDRVPLETAMELVTSAFKTVGVLRRKVSALERRLAPRRWPPCLVGDAAPVQRARMAFEQALAAELPVLILAEPGTGRRDLARALHEAGPRRRRQLAWVGCTADQAGTEIELFGCEAGAAPGISRRRLGWLELARGSTLVLDGAERLGRAAQLRLCSAIESGAFRRLGGTEQLPLDTRLIGVAGADGMRALEEHFAAVFGAIRVEIPPLRARMDDLPQVIQHLLDAAKSAGGRAPPPLHPATLGVLLAHRWPGNIRELAAVLERAALAAAGGTVLPEHLPPLRPVPEERRAGVVSERDWILEGLRRNRFRRGETARFLGVSRKTLYNKMVALGLLVPSAGGAPEQTAGARARRP